VIKLESTWCWLAAISRVPGTSSLSVATPQLEWGLPAQRAQIKLYLATKVSSRTEAIELTFLGTRGEIKVRSRRHQRHSALLIEHENARIMIDCGADWLGRLHTVAPTAIVLTHAHRDHAGGLAAGAPCPVYATGETLRLLRRFPIHDRRALSPKKSTAIGGVRFRAYRVRHSIRAPAVGYRVSAKAGSFFYLPDVAKLPKPSAALHGVGVYIGDGATLRRSMVRMKDGVLIGHAAITTQLDWCTKAHVYRAIFTHCGSPIVRGDARVLSAAVRQLGREHDIDARLACDGDQLCFSGNYHD
jgi:phosphoribosyl 1,2-cyclic phosphodiesterase